MRGPLHRLLFSRQVFRLLERLGAHLTPRHFYSPIPDTRELAARAELWERISELPGVDMNDEGQRRLLRELFPRYLAECDFPRERTGMPGQFYVRNGAFGLVSAIVLHSFIREHRPRLVLEVGSGMSTLVSTRAATINREGGRHTEVVAVEPHPPKVLRRGLPGLAELVEKPVETLPAQFFQRLAAGDILFIDSSHVVRTGGDVTFLYLEVLPRLAPGVLVHVHDIFFPREYPREWVAGSRRFWSEQYLLQGFLAHNSAWEVLWSESYARTRWPEEMEKAFPGRLGYEDNFDSSSFWMRRKS